MQRLKFSTVVKKMANKAEAFVQSNQRTKLIALNCMCYEMKMDTKEEYLYLTSAKSEGFIAACSSRREYEEFFRKILENDLDTEGLIECSF